MKEDLLKKAPGLGHRLCELELDKRLEIRELVSAKVKGIKC